MVSDWLPTPPPRGGGLPFSLGISGEEWLLGHAPLQLTEIDNWKEAELNCNLSIGEAMADSLIKTETY